MVNSEPLLEMTGIVKTFPGGLVANDDIDFSVRAGEVHALLGQNGAGKSTLMKILYGLYTPNAGEIRMRGELLDIDEPKDAIDAGIGMVHQHFKLIDRLAVGENIQLGRRAVRRDRAGISDRPSLIRRLRDGLVGGLSLGRSDRFSEIEALVEEYGVEVDLDAKVWQLDVGEQQRVEILKALYNDVDLLILDEPTATLPDHERENLFGILRQLRADGTAIVLITHKLGAALEIADRTTVLRNGSVVDTVDVADADRGRLAEMMVGREVLFDIERVPTEPTGTKLAVSGLTADDDRGLRTVDGIDFELRGGEIVGLAGISGNGQQELVECLVGLRRPSGGSVEVGGVDLTSAKPSRFVDAGVSYIPADRFKYGCAPGMSVMHNAVLKNYGEFTTGGSIDYGRAHEYTRQLIDEFDIVARSTRMPTSQLSGGNLQKLIVARELSLEPEILVAHHPTRGVDVGSIEYIREVIQEQKEADTGVFLVSDDLDEVLQMSDRILVVYEGEIVHRASHDEADRERISLCMSEGRTADAAEETATIGDLP